MATGPKISDDPIELLTPRLDVEQPVLSKYWAPVAAGAITFAGCTFGNVSAKLPPLASLHRTLVFSAAGAALGYFIEHKRSEYLAERDAALRHYISLHREEFPVQARKKIGDLFERWVPIR